MENKKLLSEESLNQILVQARTHTAWQDRPVSDDLLKQVYDLMKWGATSANCCPARIVFVKSAAAKEKLTPCLDPGNVAKTRA